MNDVTFKYNCIIPLLQYKPTFPAQIIHGVPVNGIGIQIRQKMDNLKTKESQYARSLIEAIS